MKTPWQEYKEKAGVARPWHILNKNNHADPLTSEQRYDICLECPEFISLTKQCKQCGCVMTMKTKIQAATCPLGKW
jgi:hypothetical protein